MKTAMQELIEWFYNRPEYDKTSEGYEIIEKAKELLEKEKEQIDSSFKAGMDYAEFSVPPNFNNEWEEYYNQTYNQEPKKEYQPSEKYLKKQKELMEDFVWNKMNKNPY